MAHGLKKIRKAISQGRKRLRARRENVSSVDFLRAQQIQNKVISRLAPAQQQKLTSFNFNPVLGQSGDTALAQTSPRPRTLLTSRDFRSDDRSIRDTVRHEVGHQLLGVLSPRTSSRKTIPAIPISPQVAHATTKVEHNVMSQFGVQKPLPESPGETFGVPNLASKRFGGPGINPFRRIAKLVSRTSRIIASRQ